VDEVALVTLYNTSEMEGRAEKHEARRVSLHVGDGACVGAGQSERA